MSNAILGSGILVLPYGIRIAGWSAIVLLGYTAWSAAKTYKFLVCAFHAEGDLNNEQLRYNYMQVTYATFGPFGEVTVGILLRILYIMIAAQFLDLCGETIGSISTALSRSGWIVLSALIVLLLVVAVPNLKDMSWLSAVGILNNVVCVVTILLISVREIFRNPRAILSGLSVYPFFIAEGVFLTLPMYLASMGAMFAVPSVYFEMQDKRRFARLMELVYFVVLVGKLIFTITAFAAFQSNTRDIISLNVESYIGRAIISVSIVIDKLLTLPLVIYSTRREIETEVLSYICDCTWLNGHVLNLTIRFVVTSVILTLSVTLAMLISNFAVLMSLAGTVLGFTISMIVPTVGWYKLASRKSAYDLFCAAVICLISSFGIVAGLYSNIINLKTNNVFSRL